MVIARCLSCHGPDQQKGDVRLDSADALRKGPDGGPLFVAGKPEESRLMEVLSHDDTVLVNRISRIRRNHRFTWPDDREKQMSERVFGPNSDNRFRRRIEIHIVLSLVSLNDLFAQVRDAFG